MPANSAQMRGVYTIPVTPFDDHGDVDEDSLRNCVQFCVDAGAHGVVAPVNASEAPLLSEQERLRVANIVVETVNRRVPVVIGVSAPTTRLSQLFAQHAHDIGADAVMAMPPYAKKASTDELLEYFGVVVGAARRPVFIQNWSGPVGTPMTAAFMARLIEEIDGVEYIKEETLPAGHVMSEMLRLVGPRLKGIMGGMAGRFMLDEFARGACGTMPACESTDVHVAIWNALESGDTTRARALHNRLIPLLNIEWMYGPAIYKEVLRRRGVIQSAKLRGPGAVELDAADHRELDAILADVSELFTTAQLVSGDGVAARSRA
ncbi:MAG: dihydrodipicolinate synthase family protein [Chloroflexi bacterium]|nr:dihydrodipicolinate synthase family protein [Chloroflexota bacterium]